MLDRAAAKTASIGAVMLLSMLAGCSHVRAMHWPHWPWRHKETAPAPVHELDVSAADGAVGSAEVAQYPQYWKRNTLVVDLQSVSGSGAIVLKPREHTTWPVRVAFRVMPGSIGLLEVRGEQRTLLPITPSGTKPIDLELVPGIYTPKTPQLTVSWGPNPEPPTP